MIKPTLELKSERELDREELALARGMALALRACANCPTRSVAGSFAFERAAEVLEDLIERRTPPKKTRGR